MTPSELEELIEQAAREEWEELNLGSKEIKVLPAAIGKCKKLKKLILGEIFSSNTISSLPIEIGKLTNLQSLDLSFNSLSEIPDSITRLQKLTLLNLDENPITEPPL